LGEIWKQGYDNLVVVSPDVGGVVRARALAKRLDDAELAIIDKRRPRPNEAEVMHIIGEVQRLVVLAAREREPNDLYQRYLDLPQYAPEDLWVGTPPQPLLYCGLRPVS
ncbi:hypothetical protein TI04_12885, partial [Achromatium sp. WMS2]